MTDQSAPDWILAYTAEVRDLLGLDAWDITVKMVDELDGDGSIGAQCQYKEPYRVAHVLLQRGRTEAEYREFVMHEMLHCALAPMDFAAITAVRLVPKPQRKVAQDMINDGCERAVQALARALVKGIKPPAPQETPTP